MSLLSDATLCSAAGFNIGQMTPPELYTLAGKILVDETLRQNAVLFLDGSVLQPGTRAKILRSWPESERMKLRERVTGVVQMEKRK
jgi:hypothetical protein